MQVDEAARVRIAEYMQRFDRDRDSEDVLFGTRTIGELTDEELALVYRRAARRVRILRAVLENEGAGVTAEHLADLILEGFQSIN